jgi:hypothetical protein
MGNDSPLPNFNQIDLTPIDSFSLSARRNKDLPLLPPTSLPVGPFPMLPATTPKVLAPLQRTQIPLGGIADKHHVPTMAAIPTIRAAPGHMSLTAKANAAVATSSALNPDLRAVIHKLRRVVRVFRAGESEKRAERPLPKHSRAAPAARFGRGRSALPPLTPKSPEEPKSSDPCEPI